ncbi:MAG: hypothetical protein ACOC36_05830, partial [Fibrobacterota bacterium]
VRRGVRSDAAERRTALGALVGAGMTINAAKQAVGFSAKSDVSAVMRTPEVQETVAQVRERLQHTTGYRLEDSAKFYKDISEDQKKVTVSDRLRSRTRLDSLLGLDSPQKVEVHETQELTQAIMVLSNLPLNPADLIQKIKTYTPTSTPNGVSVHNSLIDKGSRDESN